MELLDNELQQKLWEDPKYRNFAAAVDKALRSFENTTEWADLITALTKLNKVLESNMKFKAIPKKVTVSKRLAQCLHPALPGGVHLRALQVYNTIFNLISRQQMVQDMFIYSAGLFPTMSFAAMKVKPELLRLYEDHFVPLEHSVRPALPGLLAGLLPGLEEGSEYSQRASELLDSLCQGVDPIFFYGSIWHCVLYNPGIRLQAITYVLNHLKKKSMEDQIYMMGTDINLMVEALNVGVNDSNVYAQRSFFDFMISAFPLHNSLLTHEDMIKILMATLNVVLRRDMSLNRRLYFWLLGSDEGKQMANGHNGDLDPQSRDTDGDDMMSDDDDNQYFCQYSRKPLLEALKIIFRQHCDIASCDVSWKPDLRPYRILMCLIDKPEIGTAILEDVLLDVLKCLKNQCCASGESQSKTVSSHTLTANNDHQEQKSLPKQSKELVKTVNLLVGTFEPNLLWEYISNLFKSVLNTEGCHDTTANTLNVKEYRVLACLLLDILSLDTQPQTRTVFLPSLLHSVIGTLKINQTNLRVDQVKDVITLCSKILSHILPSKNFERTYSVSSQMSSEGSLPSTPVHVPSHRLPVYTQTSAPANAMHMCVTEYHEFFACYVQSKVLKTSNSSSNTPAVLSESFSMACQLLVDFCGFLVYEMDPGEKRFQNHLNECKDESVVAWVSVLIESSQSSDHNVLYTAISTLLELMDLTKVQIDTGISPLILDTELLNKSKGHHLYEQMARRLWWCIGQSHSHSHSHSSHQDQKMTDLFVQLNQLSPSPWICESVIIEDFTAQLEHVQLEAYKKFSTLWHLSRHTKLKLGGMSHHPRRFDRCLLFMLDGLQQTESAGHSLVTDWLLQAIQRADLTHIVEPLLLLLLHIDTARISIQHIKIHKSNKSNSKSDTEAANSDCGEDRIYAISNEDGNVIYHVGDRRDHQQAYQANSLSERTSAMTSIKDEFSYHDLHKTEVHQGEGETKLACDEVLNQAVNLTINPFGSDTSLDQAISAGYVPTVSDSNSVPTGARRLNAEVCKQEGIYFHDESPSDDSDVDSSHYCKSLPDDEDDNVGDMVRDIIGELIDNVVRHGDHNIDTVETMLEQRAEYLSASGVRFVRSNSVNESLASDEIPSDIEATASKSGQTSTSAERGEETVIQPWHAHMLLYSHKYDCERVYYALKSINAMIVHLPKVFVQTLCSTTLGSKQSPHQSLIQDLLARHRKSILGKSFYGEAAVDSQSGFRSTTYLEIIILVCLYYLRSYFPDFIVQNVPLHVVQFNKYIQTVAAELMVSLLSDIRNTLQDCSESFTALLLDVFQKTKLQKLLPYFLIVHIHCKTKPKEVLNQAFSDTVIINNTNAVSMDWENHYGKKIMEFLHSLILLESVLLEKGSLQRIEQDRLKKVLCSTNASLRNMSYMNKVPIIHQNMFITIVVNALIQQHNRQVHLEWLDFFIATLQHFVDALPYVIVPVIQQTCANLEDLSKEYQTPTDSSNPRNLASCVMPVDYGVRSLENLAKICHFPLVDSRSSLTSMRRQTSVVKSVSTTSIASNDEGDTHNLLTNIRYLFTSANKEATGGRNLDPFPYIGETRKVIMCYLQYILLSLARLWKAVSQSENTYTSHPCWKMGHPKAIKSCILELVGPLSVHNGVELLTATSNAWQSLKRHDNDKFKVIQDCTEDQLYLVDLLCSLRVLPPDSFIQTTNTVLRNNQSSHAAKILDVTVYQLQVNLLEMMYYYLNKHSASQLKSQWSTLYSFLKDGLQLTMSGTAQLMLLAILHMFVQKVNNFESKKDKKDLQEITQKLVEVGFMWAGSSLEQTAWFGKNFQVKTETLENHPVIDDRGPGIKMDDGGLAVQQSIQALNLLATVMTPLLDTVYDRGEKDKIATILTKVLHNVFPYLKHHSKSNRNNFRPASQILAGISDYPYTRKAWRREAFDIFLNPDFFQMDRCSILSWKSVIDNLMTHDRTSFKELLGKIPVPGSGALNLFTSKDAEYEMRAQLIKRLTFAIFCSEKDQYEKFIPSIQACLAENIKLFQAPVIQTEIFYCFRVLLWKMSPRNLNSLWPTIVTELVQVLLQLEQQLIEVHSSVDAGREDPKWLTLYLAACKLLDLALVLPADMQPQFQLYQWAFAGDVQACQEGLQTKNSKKSLMYIPHVSRISMAFAKKFGRRHTSVAESEDCLLRLTSRAIWSIRELEPFFTAVTVHPSSSSYENGPQFLSSTDILILHDFLEHVS